MSGGIGVVAELTGYRVAVAGLPRRTRLAQAPAGAIVVVDGAAEWCDAAALAIERGAAAILVAEPLRVPPEAIERLEAMAAEAAVPVVVHRARLRADLVALAVEHREGVAPQIIVAECRAAAGALPLMVRDAVGWMRALAGVPLVASAWTRDAQAGTALLRSRADGRVVGSMVHATTRPEGELFRVQALGETTSELEIDDPVGRCELSTSTARGRLVAPTHFEDGHRMALRRAVDAVVAGARSTGELGELRHDAAVCADLFS